MQEYSTIPHRKTCFAIFLVSCLLLTILYYDEAVSRYRAAFPSAENTDQTAAANAHTKLFNSTRENITALAREDDELNLINNSSIIITKISKTTAATGIVAPCNTSIGTSVSDKITRNKKDFNKYPTEPSLLYKIIENESEDVKFLVSSSKCKIIDIDAFDNDAKIYFRSEKYKSCRKLDLLTYVTKTDNTATLHIDNDMAPSYSLSGVSCCYSNVTRKNLSDTDIIVSNCKGFTDNVTLPHDPVIVKCTDLTAKRSLVYENVHIAITPTEAVQKRMNISDNTTKPISVLFVGIDSISRLNLIRSMPNTYAYLEQNGWIPLKGYNKIDDNTFPNLMAILTGFNRSGTERICNPGIDGKLDNCPMLWYHFKDFGYITGYGEDEATLNTFNYFKKGFRLPPTDYYFRSYVQATEKLKKTSKDGMTYCTGPETAGERILNLAKDFATTFKDYPSFGFFWMNSFSHNGINSPSGMDNKAKGFLEDLAATGVTDNSIIVFLSDHGVRFGKIRQTDVGWLEERLPYIYVSFPRWFQEKFSNEYNNFRNNTNKLTCPYDLHMTLKHILLLSGLNHSIASLNYACPQCKSLFEVIQSERSCEDAAIPLHWCTCTGYRNVVLDKTIESNVTNFVLKKLDSITQKNGGDKICAKYSVSHIEKMRMSQHLPYKNESYLLIRIRTRPKAVFETTLSFIGDISSQNFSLSGDISRLDLYSHTSSCMRDAYLKKFCYCLASKV